ncbi:Hpt domain-containing protein [Marinospirillum alkaliphilum]|uniref:Hpt domain-containing protein n=1 Tax=Marinospirillum alkaliphilum DSM 21637 TaxID=1122209 RepID=A0A1K1X3F8_9GAMM|nr:Hpt domain-containing protein [Marinospirillum alkaliphilum]SFX44055.1 Hpt domain-containing protein [Marinospirillum alkaliphilum DSM 21637]
MHDQVRVVDEFELLQQGFIGRLPARLACLQDLLKQWLELSEESTLNQLHREAHNLTGAAGSYQLEALSLVARQLEQGLRAACAGEALNVAQVHLQLQAVAEEIARLNAR